MISSATKIISQNLLKEKLSVILLISGLLILFFLPRNILFNDSVSFCLHKKFLKFDCPGCGMTRALYSVLHFDFLTALKLNFGVFILFPFVITEILVGLKFNILLFRAKNMIYNFLCFALILIYMQRIYIWLI